MNFKTFESFKEALLKRVEQNLQIKGREYSPTGEDRLIQFKRGGRIRNRKPEDVALDWFTKHLTSIEDLINGSLEPTWGLLMEKFGDAIAYLVLTAALIAEKMFNAEEGGVVWKEEE